MICMFIMMNVGVACGYTGDQVTIRTECSTVTVTVCELSCVMLVRFGTSKSAARHVVDIAALKDRIIGSLEELRGELDVCIVDIASTALEHIHADEIVMTMGYSASMEEFLFKAASSRKFDVVLCDTASCSDTAKFATALCDRNIQTTVIPDSNMFGMSYDVV